MYTSHLEVNIKVLITVETDEPIQQLSCNQMRSLVAENAADLISQYDDQDLMNAIWDWKIVDTKEEVPT